MQYITPDLSAWGEKAEKSQGDPALRPCPEKPIVNELTEYISKLALAHKNSNALCYGDFRTVVLQNKHCIFERKTDTERVLVAINADENEVTCHFDAGCGTAVDLITGNAHDFGGGSDEGGSGGGSGFHAVHRAVIVRAFGQEHLVCVLQRDSLSFLTGSHRSPQALTNIDKER